MTSPQARKGNRWETAIRDYFRERGFVVYRPRQEGLVDVGDLHVEGFVLQAKAWSSWEAAIREGLDGAVRQAEAWDERTRRTGDLRSIPAAVVKRVRRPVGDAYVVLRLSDLARILDR